MKTITAYLYAVLLALAGFAPAGFAATDYINVQFSNGGASQIGAAVIGSAGDYWNKTTGKSGSLSLNKTDNTDSGAALSWSASGVGSTGTNNAFIAQNTAWKNLFSGQIYAASGSTMTANFSGLTANIPVRVYFYSENDQGGNGRKLQASLNGGAYAATTVGSDNTVYSFIKNQNYLVVDGTATASGQLSINLKGVSGARDGIGILMGIQLIASNDIPSLTLTTPNFENVGAGMATLLLQASADATGYFTLLAGSNTACGTAAQVQAGLTNSGATASYHGSLPLTANIQGRYTVRNLTQLTDYTVCFTADSPTLPSAITPVSANLSTTAAHLSGPAWSVVGTAGFSAGVATYTSLAFAPDGTPYLAYADYINALGKATVVKFNGSSWVVVGTGGFSSNQAGYLSLAFAPDGTPYAAYRDGGNSGKATVKKFDGSSWVAVGTAGFTANVVYYTSLAFSPDGTPYVAYSDGNTIFDKATVMKFNGTAWVLVGTAGFSDGAVKYTSLAFAPDGTPYLAYQDAGNSSKATVKKFNGTAWVTVGAAGFSAGQAAYTSLAIAPDGTPYLAYRDAGNSNNATVMKFDGTAWVAVGTAGFSAGQADYTSLAFAPDGTPYLAYSDSSNSTKATVMQFNGTAWVAVGTAGFSAGGASYTSLAFAPNGTPFLAFMDGGNSNKATVMKFASNQTATATALQSSLNPSKFNQLVTLTAAVSPSAATGSVTFKEGSSDLGTSSLSNGSATYVNSALSVGSHDITAVYAGDTSYSGSTSNPLTQTINKADTTTAVVSSLNPSYVGDAVTFTATVTPSATGTVNFFDGASSLGSGTLNGSSQASVNTSALTVGGHSITGVYNGNAGYNTSTSPPLPQTVIASPAPSLTTPSFENVGASLATLLLQTNKDGTGYFTLLAGSNAACGTAAQVKAGLTSTGAIAPYHGSLPLTANTQGRYTVRNLTQSTDYTVCFTADSPTLPSATPVSANLSTTAANLNGSAWSVVGTAGFSADVVSYTSLAFAPDGTPYLAYRDNGNSGKATVMKFDGTAWASVGSAGFSAGAATYTSLAFAPDGTPYLAYRDIGNGERATVMKFNGTAWAAVGSAGFSADVAAYTSLAFAPNGTPYLAYRDAGNSFKATVMKFDGTAWVTVGSAGFSADVANYTSLAFAPNGTFYVAYQDAGNSNKATVMQFDGTVWVTVGSAGFSADVAAYTSLAFAPNGTPYLAYQDSGYSNKATVMQFNGTAWVPVGSAGFSAGKAQYTSLAFAPEGTPYVAYEDYGNGLKATVMKFDGTAWVTVGSAGFSTDMANYTSLAFAPDGTPYVGYKESDNSLKATVMKFTNNQTATTTALQSSLNPAGFGQSVTLTASVSPSAATGSVTFKDGGSTLSTSALSNGSATYVSAALSVGSHDITAVYGGDSAYSGSTSNTLTQTVNSAGVNITVATNPSGLGITVDGTGYTAPQTFNWIAGSSHSLAVTSPQAGTAGTRYPFANWSDAGAQSHSITVPSSPATYTASFGTEYQLTLNAGTGGSIIPASGNWYAAGSTPSIISTASNSGYVFNVWSLDSGTGPVLNTASAATQVTMNGPNTVSAAFKAVTTTLSASIGSKSGTIGGIRSWNVSVSNTGGTTANAAQIDGLTLSSSGACKPVATTSFPLALGDISPNDALTGVVSINFTGCKSSIKFSVNIRYSADGGTSSGVTPLTGVSQ